MKKTIIALSVGLVIVIIIATALSRAFAEENSAVSSWAVIGDAQSEAGIGLAAENASEAMTRSVDGREFTYRTLDKDGSLVFNVKCDPESINYLTVQLWGGDTGDGILWVCDPVTGNMNEDNTKKPQRDAGIVDRRDWVELNYTSATPQFDGGFIYSTYEIPLIYTKGRSSVSLKIYSTGGPANYSEEKVKEQTGPSRGIYALFMTQEAAFEPEAYGIFSGRGDNKADDLYGIGNAEDMAAQKAALKNAVLSGIDVLRTWQIYGDASVPSYMNGMITRTDWRRRKTDDWKNAYYSGSFMLKQNLTPLNMTELASYAWKNADELGVDGEEMRQRVIAATDFLCRAQGSNGGFNSENGGWIGGPDRQPAGGSHLTGFGLRASAQAIIDILPSMTEGELNEMIDSDADDAADKTRKSAWLDMMSSARDYLIDLDGGYGHAPNQDMANSIAALRFDTAIGQMGGTQLSRAKRTKIFAICFGDEKNLVTSSYWVSPKGLILENFGSVQGGYSGDYGSNAVVEMSQLARIGKESYKLGYDRYMSKVYDMIDKFYFTGKKLENGRFVPQEYTEGLISNRNAYYPGTERYPIDIYSALTLGNDTALKMISNYLTQKDIAALAQTELGTPNVHYEDNILDAAYIYGSFDELVSAAQDRYIENYSFAMENENIDNIAWADETARNVVIKDGTKRVYMALNWRAPAYTTTIYNTSFEADKQSIKANNLCRVHATGASYDSYGYAAMTTDGYASWTPLAAGNGAMEALMSVNYGDYTVIMNSYNCTGSGNTKEFAADYIETAAGLDRSLRYKDMISGRVYAYSGGSWHSEGSVLKSESNSTLVLKAIPELTVSERRITEDGVSAIVTNNTQSAKKVTVYAASYLENGALKDVRSKTIAAMPGSNEIEVSADAPSRIFVWDENNRPLD